MIQPRVVDLTIDELKELIREAVTQAIVETLGDPDMGLELREEMKAHLRRSLEAVEAGGETIPAEVVATRLGLDW
ncbi:MAG: hypothetical protein ACUVWR_13840 [Anaerolineae bacterium]